MVKLLRYWVLMIAATGLLAIPTVAIAQEKAPKKVKVEKGKSSKSASANKKQKTKKGSRPEKVFVDRNGDGIHDGMEHRFRRKKRHRSKGRSKGGSRMLKHQHHHGNPNR
ncbi:MAG: hypothetical protein QNJ97_19005 [Myxococcota bacterium]|nr:hypothetical protein [Myxococcota bacterium]